MIYWDANATSKMRTVAVEAARDLLSKNMHLNPSSIHSEGRIARAILRDARDKILTYLFPNVSQKNFRGRLMFVSGGSEACNSIIRGFIGTLASPQSATICTSSIEHAAILEPILYYKNLGSQVTYVNPDRSGQVDVDSFLEEITAETSLATLMLSNNETGVGQEVISICRSAKKKNPQLVFVSDISQAVSKTRFDLEALFSAGVDAVCFSAHKIGAMPGIGAVIFNTESTCRLFEPIILGGGQEDKLRGGTEFTFGAHVFGEVCEFLSQEGEREISRRSACREQLIREITHKIPEAEILFLKNTHEYDLCNTVYVRVPIRADDYAVALDIEGVKLSTGSACSSGRQDVSHVPLSMGYSKVESREFFRIAMDWDVEQEEVSRGVDIMKSVLARFL